ncbi:MAG TPA: alanine racemase [Acidobacteriota bacterium]|nr:alanine racemase [Acidobacteriota bacterium]
MSHFSRGRPTICTVDHEALRWNLSQIRAKVGDQVKILAMVKANAYGHGAVAAAKTLAAAGSDAFGVATLDEAIELRESGIRAPIVVVAGVYPDQVEAFIAQSLTPAICDLANLRQIEAALLDRVSTLKFHLKIDTGMGRLGVRAEEIETCLPQLKTLEALKLEGVFSHFSTAESVEGDHTKKQLEIFSGVVRRLRSAGITPPLVHLANSAATIAQPAAYFDMVRPGIMLYGVYPSPSMAQQISLKPVLSWQTKVLQLKKVPVGASISYGQTFITKRQSVIATLPVGYADGYHRLLSNRGEVLLRGKRAPVAGRVCMDLTMIDVTDIRGVQQGDEVVLLGRQGDAEITADEMAGWARTISYEIFTSIGARVPRIHLN